jgi:putative hydrolase of the HAD superfamily
MFDLDGTLVDDHSATKSAVNVLAAEYSWIWRSAELAWRDWKALVPRYWALYASGSLSLAEARRMRMAAFARAGGSLISDVDVDELCGKFEAARLKAWRGYGDAAPALASLGTYPLLVVSNGAGLEQRRKLGAAGLDGCFVDVVTSEQVGTMKPGRRIFEFACRVIGVPPDRALFVGDSVTSDVRGSYDCGLQPVWLDRSGSEDGQLGCGIGVVTSLAGLQGLLR